MVDGGSSDIPFFHQTMNTIKVYGDAIKKVGKESWDYVKYQHRSVESSLSYWTMGTSDLFYTTVRAPMNSYEYWASQGNIAFMLFGGGKGSTLLKQLGKQAFKVRDFLMIYLPNFRSR
jgi:hypothetical protein